MPDLIILTCIVIDNLGEVNECSCNRMFLCEDRGLNLWVFYIQFLVADSSKKVAVVERL
jgi:hypothetical protein